MKFYKTKISAMLLTSKSKNEMRNKGKECKSNDQMKNEWVIDVMVSI